MDRVSGVVAAIKYHPDHVEVIADNGDVLYRTKAWLFSTVLDYGDLVGHRMDTLPPELRVALPSEVA